MNNKKLCLMAAALMCSSFAFGQQPTVPSDTVSSYNLTGVEVTATRVVKTSPVAHTNVSKDEIERGSYGRDIPSLLSNYPSMVSTSDAGNGVGYSDIRLRGFDGSRINVTANGVPMNDAESHKLYWVDTPDLISSVGSIQIQRGAGSSTNGAGAFGGSINLTTAPLPTTFGGEAAISYGSYNTSKQALRISSGLLGNHWAIDGRISHVSSDGYMDRASSNLTSYMFQTAYYANHTVWKFLSFGGHEKTYNAWDGLTADQMSSNRRYNPCGEITDASGKVVGFYDNQTDNYTQINNHLSMTHEFNSHWNMNITAHYTYGDGYYNQYKNNRKLKEYGILNVLDENGVEIKKSNLVRRKAMDNNFFGFVGSANYKSRNVMVSLGAAWNRYSGDHYGKVREVQLIPTFTKPLEYYRNSATKTDGNMFAKITWEMLKGLNVYADMQYRHIEHTISGKGSSWSDGEGAMQTLDIDKKYDFFNPKAGINYTNGAHTLYASFSVAEKEPRRDDFTNAMFGELPKSERLYDWEAGYQFNNKYLSAGVNFYWMQYHAQLIATGAINTDTYDVLYFNVPDSYRRGIELTLAAHVCKCFTVGGNLTLSQNRIENYVESIYSYDTWDNESRELGTTTIAYSPSTLFNVYGQFQKNGFEAILNHQHVGKQYINNSKLDNLSIGTYSVTNLNLGYTLKTRLSRSVRFGVEINNLFNEKYCSNAYTYDAYTTGGNDYYDVRYFPQACLNVLCNVVVKF